VNEEPKPLHYRNVLVSTRITLPQAALYTSLFGLYPIGYRRCAVEIRILRVDLLWGNFEADDVLPPLGSLEFSLDQVAGQFVGGLHHRDRLQLLESLRECVLQTPHGARREFRMRRAEGCSTPDAPAVPSGGQFTIAHRSVGNSLRSERSATAKPIVVNKPPPFPAQI